MKRKIAAIFAADIAGYSRLMAEDEEETLRRMASYRSVTDDFIAKAGGRIFNTAGDAVLAEFPSAVEAVRCAIDIQESLRTRNMAYPASRQMSFRIGITIGDVVERDGDLLGDGVNIAARLEGLAEVGGICVSRSVHEQVANKLSVQFADIGEQEVKNIPTPVHAYMVAMRREDGTYTTPQVKKKRDTRRPVWMWPAVALIIALASIGVRGFVNLNKTEKTSPPAVASNTPAPVVAPINPSPPNQAPPAVSSPTVSGTTTQPPSPSPAPPATTPPLAGERFSVETIPFVTSRFRLTLAKEYAPAADFKALALAITGINAFTVGQKSEDDAKSSALEQCQKKADAVQPVRKCELYAVGNTLVYPHPRPPMPSTFGIKHDPFIERPFTSGDVPFVRDSSRSRIETGYPPARKPKALSIGPGGQFFFYSAQENAEEAARRTLESCGAVAGVPCMVIAVDDVFIAPMPVTMKVIGFFRANSAASIAQDSRDDVVRRIAESNTGWNAVAVGTSGRPGLALKAANEQDAVNEALGNCVKRDSDCHIIAIGPFLVGPN